jgi:phospholipid/cholesterol/gamma-HCH transport system substrate-binding protein
VSVLPKLLLPALLAVAAVIAALLLLAGGDKPYVVKAIYADASGLTKDYDVKIDGVPAGTIKKVDLDADDHAVLTLELDKGAAPLGAGAKAYARPANLLGEKYVDLRLGDRDRPQPSGTVIPISRTGTPVELDDVLNTLDAGTRARLRILINEAGTALAGRGADFNAMLGALPGALDDTRRVVDDVNSENARLRRTISAASRVTAAVDGRHDDLKRVVTDASTALKAVAERRKQLGSTVAAAPPALAQLNGTLGELRRASSDLLPASRALRRAAPPLHEVLTTLPSFSEQTTDTLQEAQELAPVLSRLGRQATPDVRRVATTVHQLSAFSKDLAPVVRGLDRGVLRDAIGLMHGWSRVIARSDGLGHIFRVRATVDQELLTSALTRYMRGVPKLGMHPTKPARRPAATAAPQPAPSSGGGRAPKRPIVSLPAVKDTLGKVDSAVKETVGKVDSALKDTVGTVGDTVKNALGGLLGRKSVDAGGAVSQRAEPAQDVKPRDGGSDALRLFDYLFGS